MTATITTPRGQNIGENIKNYLVENDIYGTVTIDAIDTTRDIANKCNKTQITYHIKPKS